MTRTQRGQPVVAGPQDRPRLAPVGAQAACTCELCQALLALAASAMRNRQAAQALRGRLAILDGGSPTSIYGGIRT